MNLTAAQKGIAAVVALLGVGAAGASMPLQIKANTTAIMTLQRSDSAQTQAIQQLHGRMIRDSIRQERMLCLQEVQAGVRPQIDLERVCLR